MRRNNGREIREFILHNVSAHPGDVIKLVVDRFGITRQAANRHVKLLLDQGQLEATGATRQRRYSLKAVKKVFKVFPIAADLHEDEVWRRHYSELTSDMPRNVADICHYGFTEIFNNAIDHSEGTLIHAEFSVNAVSAALTITDDGIGIFEKIKRDFKLEDHRHAILELAKGKLTTDPKRHTGEGIFFTSRMFDEFSIGSGRLFFYHRAPDNDWLLEDQEKASEGTFVRMEISISSARTPNQVFDKYASEQDDYGFVKTKVPVELLRYGHENLVSRSQAKRFREIILDFSGVETVGQAFVDEIFRVFQAEHPEITIIPFSTSEQVQKMINRILGSGQKDSFKRIS